MSTRVIRLLSVLVLAAALGLVVFLSRQSETLRAEAALQRRRANFPRAGQYVPPLRLATDSGDSLTLGEGKSGERQVLLVFQAKCGFCKADAPTWKAVAKRIEANPSGLLRVIGVSVDSSDTTAHRYAREQRFTFPIVRLPTQRWMALFHARAVPTILLVDADGQILFARSGELGRRSGVDSLFAVTKRPAIAPTTVGPVKDSALR